MRSVIFDLDGTLADTSADLIAAANACFRDLGLGDVLDPIKDAATGMRGGRAMLTLGFERTGTHGQDEVDRQYPNLLSAYKQAISVHTYMYSGAMEAIEALKRNDYKVGICTNKPEALAEQLLKDLGVRNEFHSLIGADTLPVKKPDPEPLFEAASRAGGDPQKTLLVGDTATDRNTAKAAGVPSILVTFGPGGGDMAALEPEALLEDFNQLPKIVAELIG